MSFYEQNLQALFEKNPKLVAKLFSIQTNKKFEVFVDEKDPLNINIADIKNSDVLYPGVPVDETQKKLDEFVKYQRYPFLYFYGLGNGVFFKALLQNETLRRVVVVEPELELIYIALHFNDFTAEINQGRLVLYVSEDISSAEAIMIFMLAEAKIFSKTYNFFVTLEYYDRHFADEIVRVNALFIQAIEHVVRGTGNSSEDALIGLKHQVANIYKMLDTPTLMELIGQCKNTKTAVIVSTGPSLKKQLPLLKKIKDYVTIFCIDASFPILEKEGIKPDVVFSIERVIETAKFYASVSKEFCEDVIFAVTSIAHPDLFKEIKGGELQMSMRPFGYTRYFDKPDYGYLGIGMSAANMAYELVFHADFKNCILIGQDLAFAKDGSTHSDGHIYGSVEDKSGDGCLMVPAYGGEGQVKTTTTWKLFKNFYETDIACANEKGIVTVNATEGGARIEGAVEMSFADAVNKLVDRSKKKEKIKLRTREAAEIKADKEDAKQKIKQMLIYAKRIKKEVEELFLHVARQCEIMDKIDKQKLYEEVDFQELADIMGEIDHIKEYFAQQKFADMFIDATQALIMHQEIEIARLQVRDARTDNDKRQKMIEWVYAHKYWLFSLAGLIGASIDAVGMGVEMSLDFSKIAEITVEIAGQEVDVISIDHSNPLINNLADIKQMCINYQPRDEYKNGVNELKFYYRDNEKSFKFEVYMPSRDDEHYNEFAFKNSLEATVDKKRLEHLYEKNAIGFLATKENLEDKEFVEYIKELYKRFPQVSFKVFYFNKTNKIGINIIFKDILDRIDAVLLSNIYNLSNGLDIFISTHNTHQDILLFNIFRLYSDILTIHYNNDAKQLTISNAIQIHKTNKHPILQKPSYFGYSENEVIENNYSIYKLLYKDYVDNIDYNDDLHEFVYFTTVKSMINNFQCRKFILEYVRKEKQYLDKESIVNG